MKELTINGKAVELYDSMYDYVEFADLSSWREFCPEDGPKYKVASGRPVDDSFFRVSDETIEHEGKRYVHVNWGEKEKCYLREDCLNDEIWFVMRKVIINGREEYEPYSPIFASEEEAKKWLEEQQED